MTEAQKKRNNRGAMVFFLATVGMLLFGVVSQILCDIIDLTLQFVIYFIGLIPIIGLILLFYHAVVCVQKGVGKIRFLAWFLLAAALLWSGLIGVTILDVQLNDDLCVTYKIYAWAYPKKENHYLLEISHLFGPGDLYYEYPEEILEDYDRLQDDLHSEVIHAFDERDRADAIFDEYRKFHMLPVLSYTYGLWISGLFAALVIAWCIAACIVSFQVYRRGEKLVYFLCYGLLAIQMILPLLGSYGMLNCWISHPFSANWAMNVTSVAPQLGIMFGLVKTSHPKPPMLMEPGEDFWREIIEEDQEWI